MPPSSVVTIIDNLIYDTAKRYNNKMVAYYITHMSVTLWRFWRCPDYELSTKIVMLNANTNSSIIDHQLSFEIENDEGVLFRSMARISIGF